MPTRFRINQPALDSLTTKRVDSRRRALKALLVGTSALAAGCGGVIEDLAAACIDFDGPEFETGTVPAASVGTAYSANIEVSIAREPADSAFEYSFSVSGALPPGLRTYQFRSERRLQIVGTPSAAGTYPFTVSVWVRDAFASDGTPFLCWESADREFRIAVT